MSDHDQDFRARLAKELDVPDGGQYLNDFLTRIDALKKRAAEADALEDENDKLVDVVGQNAAIVVQLEDALRMAHPPGKGSHGSLIDDGIWERCPMCKAQLAAKEDQ